MNLGIIGIMVSTTDSERLGKKKGMCGQGQGRVLQDPFEVC